MKIHTLIAAVLGIVCRPVMSCSQDDSLRSYYPIGIGNVWQYRSASGSPRPPWTVAVPGDTVFPDGRTYRIVDDSRSDVGRYFERVDSATLNVYRREGSWDEEHLHDSLRASPGDTLWNVWHLSAVVCEELTADSVLGIPVPVKHFMGLVIPDLPRYGLARGFGRCAESNYYEDPVYPVLDEARSVLQYAKIDGKEFGTLLAVADEPAEPRTFRLMQNYPNPFNPATRIAYVLPAQAFTSLRIFDLLGREVATLVQSIQQAGRHTVVWNAGGLPSGVYLCRLSAGRSMETRKIVLMR